MADTSGVEEAGNAAVEAHRPQIEHFEYLGSRGATGLPKLRVGVRRAQRNGVRSGEGWAWIRYVALHGAVMNGHVDTTGVIGCDVDNRTRHGRRIWLDDLLVVGGFHYRNEIANFLNYACLSSGINKVANFEGAKHDSEHASGEP